MPVGCGLASNPVTQRRMVADGLGGLPEVVIPDGVNGNSLPLLLWASGLVRSAPYPCQVSFTWA